MAWGRDILAIEPGRLPAPDRLRKSHRREGTPLPLLNTQTPTHLDNMGFLVVRVRFLHCLGADGENVLEKTPVRSTPQEILAHGHECGKVCDGVGSEMMELSPEEIQETSKEGVWRKRETAVDMGGEQNTLTRPRLRLRLPLRQPRSPIGDQSGLSQLLQIFWPERGSDPIALDPTRR